MTMTSSSVEPAETDKLCRAGEWFLRSGIQEAKGGMARYYFSDRGRNAALTTEITAYCASSLIDLYKRNPDERLLQAAKDAANYLVKSLDTNSSAMPFEAESEGTKYSYFFDNGIIVRGLLTVWRQCGDEEYLSTARLVGDSMAKDFADGQLFSPILELPDKSALPYEKARWSRSPGCYQLKAALGWYELWQITTEERYLSLYRQLLETSLATYESFLPGVDNELAVMDRMHAYSYFLEGLLPTINEPASARAMVDGLNRAKVFVDNLSDRFLRSDVVAQLFRVKLFADQNGILPLDEDAAEKDVAILRDFQSADSDPHLNGGFWFGKKNGEMLPFMNPVSTAFCQQALDMWNDRGAPLYWETLI
jgi:hypothetical protein